MKKLLTLITGMIVGSALYAAPILNPAAPALITDGVFLGDDGCWGLKAGYRGNFIYNRNFEDRVQGAVQDFEYWSNSGVLTLTLWDRVDLYGFVGAASFDYANVQGNNAVIPTDVSVLGSSTTKTNWGVGAKVVLWESCWGSCGTTYIGIDANYERMRNNPFNRVTIEGANAAANGVAYNYYETQIALGVAHRIWNLVPYLAIKWSNAGSSLANNATVGTTTTPSTTGVTLHHLHGYRHWGWAFGTSLVDANRMTVTAEARFKDEKALSVGAEFKF